MGIQCAKNWTLVVQKEYECTCHVYGQTHKYENKVQTQISKELRVKIKCTCHVYGQIHK